MCGVLQQVRMLVHGSLHVAHLAHRGGRAVKQRLTHRLMQNEPERDWGYCR